MVQCSSSRTFKASASRGINDTTKRIGVVFFIVLFLQFKTENLRSIDPAPLGGRLALIIYKTNLFGRRQGVASGSRHGADMKLSCAPQDAIDSPKKAVDS